MKDTHSLYTTLPEGGGVYRMKKLVKSSVLTGSNDEFDTLFGDLKNGVILVNTDFKVLYLNDAAKLLDFGIKSRNHKDILIIEFIKQILTPPLLLNFYESLINQKAAVFENGFLSKRIVKITLDPIHADGFVIKIFFNELFKDTISTLFKYFPALPITYFGFELVTGKRISLRFISDNFSNYFPHIERDKALQSDSYMLTFILREDLPRFLLKLHDLKKGKDSMNLEFRILDASGKIRWYKFIANKIDEHTGKDLWLAFLEDIHENKITCLEKDNLIHETLEDERNRMAMELHDGLGQNLVALNLFLSTIESEIEKEKVDTCRFLAVESISQMKLLCYNLAPPELETGIFVALDVFFVKLNELSSKIQYWYNAKNLFKKISPEQSYNLFRIVQEFVSNSQKYSGCSIISCEIISMGNKTKLTIQDDGKGFNYEIVKKGFGIKNILKRAKLIDAKIKLDSSEGKGTKLVLVF